MSSTFLYVKILYIKIKGWFKIKINLESMQKYASNFGYQILDTKIIIKPYQKQIWTLMKCENKEHEPYWQWWNNFKTGYRCKECSGFKIWTQEKAKLFFEERGLLLVDSFVNVDKPVVCINEEGYKVFVSISNLKKRITNYCIFHKKVAIENIKLFCKKYRPEYELCSTEWRGIKAKYCFKYIGFLELKNRYFEISLDSFYNMRSGHPDIQLSKGALKIYNYLKSNEIEFETEYTFDDLKNINLLRFDFAVFNKSGQLTQLIEFQGIQHYDENNAFFSEQTLIHDNAKREYCKNKNINLLEIRYDEVEQIDEILDKFYSETKESE